MKKLKVFKSVMSLVLIVTIMAGCIPATLVAAKADTPKEEIKRHESILEAKNIDIQTGKKTINGKTSEELPQVDLYDGLLSFILSEEQVNGNTFVGDREISIEESSYYEGYSANADKVSVSNVLIADNNIAFSCSDLMGTNSYVYSKNGDITLNVGTANIDGLLYAPNGTVYLNGADVTINGAIIAKNIVVRTGTFEVNYDNEVATMISLLNKTIIDKITDLYAIYDEETDEIKLIYYEDFFESADIYVRYGNDSEFQQLEATSEMEFALDTSYLTDYVDFRAVIKTSLGEEILSTITSLEKAEDGIESIVRDSDGDRIPDGYEIWDLGTDPFNADTDGDGFDDGYEVFVLHTDPTTFEEDEDFDNDGLSNLEEMILGTNPWLPDTDFDGIIDSEDENPTITDTNTGKNINYDVEVKVGKFDVVKQYVDLDGNVTKNIYNYVTGENKFSAQGDESVILFYDMSGNATTLITNTGDKQVANTFSYDDNNNVTSIFHNGLRYDFEYDGNDALVHASIGERTLFSNIFDGNKPTVTTYGNDD